MIKVLKSQLSNSYLNNIYPIIYSYIKENPCCEQMDWLNNSCPYHPAFQSNASMHRDHRINYFKDFLSFIHGTEKKDFNIISMWGHFLNSRVKSNWHRHYYKKYTKTAILYVKSNEVGLSFIKDNEQIITKRFNDGDVAFFDSELFHTTEEKNCCSDRLCLVVDYEV